MRKLLIYLRPYRWHAAVGMIAKLVEAVLELLLPWFAAQMIDRGIAAGDEGLIFKLAFLMLGVALLGLGFALLCQYFAAVAAQEMGKEIRAACMDKIVSFSFSDLDQFGNAELIHRLTNDVNQVVAGVNMFIRLVSRAPFLCIGALVMSFLIHPLFSLLFLLFIPLLLGILLLVSKKTVPLFKKAQTKLDSFGRLVKESLSGVRVIRAFSRQEEEQRKARDTSDKLADSYICVGKLTSLLNPFTTAVVNGGIILLLYCSGVLIQKGSLLQGDAVALMNYITQILLALVIVANLMALFTKAMASAERIGEVLEVQSTRKERKRLSERNPSETEVVRFCNLSFSFYDEEVLSRINFSIKKGEMLGFIGATGSGKSVLIHLIPRFYIPTQGRIEWCGEEAAKVPLEELRREIGIAPQETVLFRGSIADNLRFGKRDASEEEMIWSLQMAEAWDFVEKLPEGLATQLLQGGKNLSGGQRQRLAIARALIKKPPLVLLDDSLSALDYQTERKVREHLATELEESAVLLASQRVSSLLAADRILVLEDGKQVGLGSHLELLETCSVYREIYQLQTGGGAQSEGI